MTHPIHDPTAPLERRVPPEAGALPAEVVADADGRIVWWRPGWGESLKYLGWRWVLLLPLLGVIGLVIAAIMRPHYLAFVWWIGVKWIIVAIALPAAALGRMMRQATHNRREPFCIHCGYTLTGLGDAGRCPECGRPFDVRLIDEYRRDPQWFIDRYNARHQLQPTAVPFDAGPVRRKRSRDGT